jgi:hypothetical protein
VITERCREAFDALKEAAQFFKNHYFPEDLGKSFFTRRKKKVPKFGCTDRGKTAYIAVRVENN